MLQKRNKIIENIRNLLKDPKITKLIFGKSFRYYEVPFQEIETEVNTDTDLSDEEKPTVTYQDIKKLLKDLESSDEETNVKQEDQ